MAWRRVTVVRITTKNTPSHKVSMLCESAEELRDLLRDLDGLWSNIKLEDFWIQEEDGRQ